MKKSTQVDILFWAKKKHQVDVKKARRCLKDEDFASLCLLLNKVKTLGGVVSVKELVEEYILHNGIQYVPQSFAGVDVDLEFFFNTHPSNTEGEIEVDLYHILLASWCKANRTNFRKLKSHLKELGYTVKNHKPFYSYNRSENGVVVLKRNYPLSLPNSLTRYTKKVKWYTSIANWITLSAPPITLNDSPYKIPQLGERWRAYFTQRFIELFNMSEVEYLYQHPQVRGCYENAPPVQVLCELTVRDLFKSTPLKDWLGVALSTSNITNFDTCDEFSEVFLDTVYDDIRGKLSKTMIKGAPIKSFEVVEGWISIIVIVYLNDVLMDYKSLL